MRKYLRTENEAVGFIPSASTTQSAARMRPTIYVYTSCTGTHTHTEENLEICRLSDFLPHMTCLLNLWTEIFTVWSLCRYSKSLWIKMLILSYMGTLSRDISFIITSYCCQCWHRDIRHRLTKGKKLTRTRQTAIVVPLLTARWLFDSSVALHTSVIVNKMDDQCYKYRGASRLGRVPAVPFKFLQFLMAQQRGGKRKIDK